MNKAKEASLQDEQDREVRIREMVTEAGGLRPTIIDAKGDGFVPPTTVTDSVSRVDRIIIEESGTRPEGLHIDTA